MVGGGESGIVQKNVLSDIDAEVTTGNADGTIIGVGIVKDIFDGVECFFS